MTLKTFFARGRTWLLPATLLTAHLPALGAAELRTSHLNPETGMLELEWSCELGGIYTVERMPAGGGLHGERWRPASPPLTATDSGTLNWRIRDEAFSDGTLVRLVEHGDAAAAGPEKQVFAHYMIGITPNTNAWEKRYQSQSTYEAPFSDKTGGRYREYVHAPYAYEADKVADAHLEIRRALRAGIDGFSFNYFGDEAKARETIHAFFQAAAEGGYPFTFTLAVDSGIMPDRDAEWGVGGPSYMGVVDIVRWFCTTFEESPHLARYKGRVPVFTYQGVWLMIDWAVYQGSGAFDWTLANDGPDTWWWQDPALRNTEAGWHFMAEAFREAARDALGDADAIHWVVDMDHFFYGAPESPSLEDWGRASEIVAGAAGTVQTFLPVWSGQEKALARAGEQVEGGWSQPVFLQYVRDTVTRETLGLANLEEAFSEATARDSRLLEVTTWNDYNEATNISPGINSRYAAGLVLRHYIHRWRTGADLSVSEDEIYIFNRKYLPGAPEASIWDTWTQHAGRLAVAVALTEPAEVVVEGFGGWEAQAGFSQRSFPLAVGPVAVEIIRGGEVVERFTHLDALSPVAWRQDLLLSAHCNLGRRLWERDFPGAPYPDRPEYGDLDGDGLPNWFEGVFFGRIYDWMSLPAVSPGDDPAGTGKTLGEHLADGTNPVQ